MGTVNDGLPPLPLSPFQELKDVRTSQNRRQLCQVGWDWQILVLQLFQILANRPFTQRNDPDIPLIVYSPRGTDPVLVAINELPHYDINHFVDFGMVVAACLPSTYLYLLSLSQSTYVPSFRLHMPRLGPNSFSPPTHSYTTTTTHSPETNLVEEDRWNGVHLPTPSTFAPWSS
jgi:hypothetical protein